jgi:hypothetical protein
MILLVMIKCIVSYLEWLSHADCVTYQKKKKSHADCDKYCTSHANYFILFCLKNSFCFTLFMLPIYIYIFLFFFFLLSKKIF